MSYAAFQPRLRLVGGEDAQPLLSARPLEASIDEGRRAIVAENRLAAHAGSIDQAAINARDPRWILAMQTQSRLQGAMLTPERRDELLASGKSLGLRQFESSLVIAVVQDQARREKPLRLADATLGMIGLEHTGRQTSQPKGDTSGRWLIAAIGGATALAIVMIRWLLLA